MSYRSSRSDNIVPILAIIVLCFLLYIRTEAAARLMGYNLIQLLGLQTASFLAQPWTILTNLFVHGGIWHLVFNMLTLYFFGTFLIRLIGIRDFLIIYFGGGILGHVFFMLLGSSFAIVIGASGAIFALGGALTVLTPRLRVYVFPIPAPIPLWAAVLGVFVIMSFVPGIAWQGHLGGLVFGLIYGLALRRRIRTPL